MANTVANVATGKPKVTGGVWRAPKGTTLPTNATTALAAAYVSMGYVSEDGVVNSNSPSTSDIKAWGGDVVLSPQSEKPDTFQFTLIEVLNTDVLKAVYGDDNVSTASGVTIVVANSKEGDTAVWVIETALRGSYKRIVIPSGQVTEIGDITYKDEEAVGYQVTVKAFPDSTGNTHYEYIEAIPAAATT